MTGVGHAQPVSHAAAAAGNLTQFPNFWKECDRRVRFDNNVRSTAGGDGSTGSTKPLNDKVAEQLRPSGAPDGVIPKDKQTGEIPPFGENKAQQQAQKNFGTAHQGSESCLRGKLKWLFEQDRKFWESNSAKSSRRGSPVHEVDRSKSLNGALSSGKLAVDSVTNAKLMHVVEENSKRVCSKKSPLDNRVDNVKSPKKQPIDKAMVSREDGLSTDRHSNSSAAKAPWTFSNRSAKFWPCGKSKAQNSDSTPHGETKPHCPAVRHSSVGHTKRVKRSESAALVSSLEHGGEEILSGYDDAPNSGESSDMDSSSDEEGEEMKKVDVAIARGGDGSLKGVKNQAAYLKVKCEMLAKEKDHALRKWKRSCLEIDDASKMAQALRTAIETLLEASGNESRADFQARKDILEDQTEVLKMRMEKLRRKNSAGLRRQAKEKGPKTQLEDRVEILKRASEGRSLASPDVPRDTEYKVEALRARLEKLMFATNSRISNEEGQRGGSARERKKPVEDWLRKSHPDEKAELKMKGWFNSLSAELTSEESPTTSSRTFDKCSGASGFICRDMHPIGTPFTSKQATPFTSKQESPWSSAHDRERDGPESAPSSEETKKNVIHKIAEEVRLEAEQWFQVQELLGRVGEDMKTLEEACSTWERRAILAEAQVVHVKQELGEEKKEKTLQQGDIKFAELQKEMLRLQETVHEVKQQMGNIDIDPHRWFEAAHTYGYAFMPVALHLPDASGACKSKCKCSTCYKGNLGPSDQWRERNSSVTACKSQPSSSANSSMASSTITLSETTPAEDRVRQRAQIPSQHWANEIARAEEDEIMTTTNAGGQVSRVEFANNTVTEMSSLSEGKLQEVSSKPLPTEVGLESSDSRKDMLLQMQASIRERCSSILQLDKQESKHSILTASRRSPLKDVLENVASAKENKRPH